MTPPATARHLPSRTRFPVMTAPPAEIPVQPHHRDHRAARPHARRAQDDRTFGQPLAVRCARNPRSALPESQTPRVMRVRMAVSPQPASKRRQHDGAVKIPCRSPGSQPSHRANTSHQERPSQKCGMADRVSAVQLASRSGQRCGAMPQRMPRRYADQQREEEGQQGKPGGRRKALGQQPPHRGGCEWTPRIALRQLDQVSANCTGSARSSPSSARSAARSALTADSPSMTSTGRPAPDAPAGKSAAARRTRGHDSPAAVSADTSRLRNDGAGRSCVDQHRRADRHPSNKSSMSALRMRMQPCE